MAVDMIILTAEGAYVYASGCQACIGKSAIFMPNPIRIKTKAACTTVVEYRGGSSMRRSAIFREPVMI
jgi:hypothetical protein